MDADVVKLEALTIGPDERLIIRVNEAFDESLVAELREAFTDLGINDRVLIFIGDREAFEFTKVAA